MADWQLQARAYGEPTWIDITDFVLGDMTLTEGRDIGSLGGALPRGVPADLVATLDATVDPTLISPGAEIRLLLGANANTLSQRFIGRLSEIDDDGYTAVIHWHDILWKLSQGSGAGGSDRLFVNQTAESIFEDLCLDAGIAAGNISADQDEALYTRLLPRGVDGIEDLEATTGGFVRGQRDGDIHLELPDYRLTAVATRNLTDQVALTGEIEIPEAVKLTRPFGVINEVEAALEVYAPTDADPQTTIFRLNGVRLRLDGVQRTISLTFDTGGLIGSGSTLAYELHQSFQLVVSPDFSGSVQRWQVAVGGVTIDVTVQDFTLAHDGTHITLGLTYMGTASDDQAGPVVVHTGLEGTVTLTNTHHLEFTPTRFSRPYFDQESIDQYGRRPRRRPLVVGSRSDAPLPDTFAVDAATETLLRTIALQELEALSQPLPVYRVQTDYEPFILARQLSDLEHLRLAAVEGDFFVEAMETTLSPADHVEQTVYYAFSEARQVDRTFLPGARYHRSDLQLFGDTRTIPVDVDGISFDQHFPTHYGAFAGCYDANRTRLLYLVHRGASGLPGQDNVYSITDWRGDNPVPVTTDLGELYDHVNDMGTGIPKALAVDDDTLYVLFEIDGREHIHSAAIAADGTWGAFTEVGEIPGLFAATSLIYDGNRWYLFSQNTVTILSDLGDPGSYTRFDAQGGETWDGTQFVAGVSDNAGADAGPSVFASAALQGTNTFVRSQRAIGPTRDVQGELKSGPFHSLTVISARMGAPVWDPVANYLVGTLGWVDGSVANPVNFFIIRQHETGLYRWPQYAERVGYLSRTWTIDRGVLGLTVNLEVLVLPDAADDFEAVLDWDGAAQPMTVDLQRALGVQQIQFSSRRMPFSTDYRLRFRTPDLGIQTDLLSPSSPGVPRVFRNRWLRGARHYENEGTPLERIFYGYVEGEFGQINSLGPSWPSTETLVFNVLGRVVRVSSLNYSRLASETDGTFTFTMTVDGTEFVGEHDLFYPDRILLSTAGGTITASIEDPSQFNTGPEAEEIGDFLQRYNDQAVTLSIQYD